MTEEQHRTGKNLASAGQKVNSQQSLNFELIFEFSKYLDHEKAFPFCASFECTIPLGSVGVGDEII
jgi:hypothetical protein